MPLFRFLYRYLVILALVMGFTAMANAQLGREDSPGTIEYGGTWGSEKAYRSLVMFTGTVGFTNLGLVGQKTSQSRLNQQLPAGGLLVQIGRKFLSFETGVLFLPSGGTFEASSVAGTYREDIELQYVAVPAFLKFNYFQGPSSSFYFKAGVLRTSLAKEDVLVTVYDAAGKVKPLESNYKRSDVYKKIELLGLVGVGGSTPVNRSTNFNLEVSWLQAFENSLAGKDGAQKNQGMSIMAGLTFEAF